MKLKLTRIVYDGLGTLGVMSFDGIPRLTTLELPWLDNAHLISCIPEGSYQIYRRMSYKHGETFGVKDVPDRSDIELHVANEPKDLKGCIGLGLQFHPTIETPYILESKEAFGWFMRFLKGLDSADLEIVGVF